MSLRTFQRAVLMSVLALGAVSASGCDDEETTTPAADGGGNGGPNNGGNEGTPEAGAGDAGDAGGGEPGLMCEGVEERCTDGEKVLGQIALPACCEATDLDAKPVCGVNGEQLASFLPGIGSCFEKHAPGDPAPEAASQCNTVLDFADGMPGDGFGMDVPAAGGRLVISGCCRPNGKCGAWTDVISVQGEDAMETGTLSLEMGCLSLTAFNDLIPDAQKGLIQAVFGSSDLGQIDCVAAPPGEGGAGEGGVGDGG